MTTAMTTLETTNEIEIGNKIKDILFWPTKNFITTLYLLYELYGILSFQINWFFHSFL